MVKLDFYDPSGGIEVTQPHPLFRELEQGAQFYFLHSYYFAPDRPQDVMTTTDYSGRYASAATARGNVFGVQFHPEFTSTPRTGHPLFKAYIAAAMARAVSVRALAQAKGNWLLNSSSTAGMTWRRLLDRSMRMARPIKRPAGEGPADLAVRVAIEGRDSMTWAQLARNVARKHKVENPLRTPIRTARHGAGPRCVRAGRAARPCARRARP